MTEEELARTLLVRAVEEHDPSFFSAAHLEEAESRAGDIAGGRQWVQKRADRLFPLIPQGVRSAASLRRITPKLLLVASVPAFLAGAGADFLGPASSFHVLYNPLIALVLWNVVMIAAAGAWIVVSFLQSGSPSVKAGGTGTPAGEGAPAPSRRSVMSLQGGFWASLWVRMHRLAGTTRGVRKAASSTPDIVRRFWSLYLSCCGRRASARAKLVLHLAALSLLAGAVAGVYLRGAFSEYGVVWRSTFIRDPEVVRLLLNVVLGVPSRIVTGDIVTAAQVLDLMSPAGSPAAPWIHLLTAATLLFAFLPRLVLLCAETVNLRTKARCAAMDMGDAYVVSITRRAWEKRVSALRDDLAAILSSESERFVESVTAFVRDELYDRAIVPRLAEFREQGGRIADLEAAIVASCRAFERPLEGFIAAMQEDLKTSVSSRITALMGRELSGLPLEIEHGAVHTTAEGASRRGGDDLTDTFTGLIHMTITTVITGTVAAVSGGFGKTLGIAVVTVLLHTSGPVGWLVGAIIGLLVAGGVSWAAKDKISDAVKDYPMPSFLTKRILSRERLDEKIGEGRAKICHDVRKEVQRQLDERVRRLKDPLLAQMVEMLASRQCVPLR